MLRGKGEWLSYRMPMVTGPKDKQAISKQRVADHGEVYTGARDHATATPLVIDRDLTLYDVIWAAAGTPNAVFAIKPDDLVRATNGRTANLKVELECS